jgi:TRAP-type C4-dicarboxylate transport system permease small subunit
MNLWMIRAIRSLEWFTGILFLILFLLNILRITLRYFLGVAWLWEPDFSRLLFIWIVFIGATVLYAGKGHLVVDFFLTRMESNTREHMHFVIDLVTSIFLTILVLRGIEVTKVRMRIPFDTWDLPTGYAYMAVPVCGAIMIVVTLVRMAEYLSDRRKR